MVQTAGLRKVSVEGLINLRVSAADRSIIDRAAKSAGKTRTEFMLDAARRAAQEAVLDATLVTVDGASFRQLKTMFDAPPKPPEGLRRLLSLEAPWER